MSVFLKNDAGGEVTVNVFRVVVAVAAALFVVTVVWGGWFIVSPGEIGLLTRAGSIQDQTFDEGFHFKLPLVETNHTVNVQTITYDGEGIDAGTRDLQSVTARVAVIFNVDKSAVKDVFRNYRDVETLEGRALRPVIEETFKAAAARHTAEELITQRAVVRDELMANAREKLLRHYVIVKDINITDFSFSRGFSAAVESKVTAEQQAKKASHDLNRIKTEGEQRVAQATAEAEAIRVQAEAVTKQGGAEYVHLRWIDKWDGKMPTTQVSSNVTPFIGLPQASK